MKPSDIRARHIYCNRGKGKVLRFVLGIGEFVPSAWHSMEPRPGEPGVRYRDSKGRKGVLYLKSFASWCGKCVGYEHEDGWTITEEIDPKLLEAFKEL